MPANLSHTPLHPSLTLSAPHSIPGHTTPLHSLLTLFTLHPIPCSPCTQCTLFLGHIVRTTPFAARIVRTQLHSATAFSSALHSIPAHHVHSLLALSTPRSFFAHTPLHPLLISSTLAPFPAHMDNDSFPCSHCSFSTPFAAHLFHTPILFLLTLSTSLFSLLTLSTLHLVCTLLTLSAPLHSLITVLTPLCHLFTFHTPLLSPLTVSALHSIRYSPFPTLRHLFPLCVTLSHSAPFPAHLSTSLLHSLLTLSALRSIPWLFLVTPVYTTSIFELRSMCALHSSLCTFSVTFHASDHTSSFHHSLSPPLITLELHHLALMSLAVPPPYLAPSTFGYSPRFSTGLCIKLTH